jgi:transcriptional regulator with XRE-family HTH domain
MFLLNEVLRTKRKELNIEPEDIASQIGKSLRAYLYYEDKKKPRMPDPETLIKLSKVLQFSIGDVYAGATSVQKPAENATLPSVEEKAIEQPTEETHGAEQHVAMQTLFMLAEATVKLADTNQRQTKMLEQKYASANTSLPSKNGVDVLSMLHNLQEVVLRLSQREELGNANEVAALLYKTDPDPVQRVSAKDIQKG